MRRKELKRRKGSLEVRKRVAFSYLKTVKGEGGLREEVKKKTGRKRETDMSHR